jgi:hypothetical protein
VIFGGGQNFRHHFAMSVTIQSELQNAILISRSHFENLKEEQS